MNVKDRMVRNRHKLQSLLRELFQFDSADLDFGIYRIMNQKRDEIERFIEEDLLDAVEDGFAQFRSADRRDVETKLQEKRQAIGEEGFDGTGKVHEEFMPLAVVKDYLALKDQLDNLGAAEESEARVFNDLYTFFSRYYENGDFLTERRWSSREPKFAVPYDGEEVLLHWANRHQYYVKTSERFIEYCFTLNDYVVRFRLQRAEVPQDIVKGEKRYFVLRHADAVQFDAPSRTLSVFFEYRQITEDEQARFVALYNARQPRDAHRKTIDRLALCRVLERQILDSIDDADLRVRLGVIPQDKPSSVLFQHLSRYTARNTQDYFIHKDLARFLRRELDFFLKTQVLGLEDVLAHPSRGVRDHLLARARVVKHIAERVIALLAQIEEFQKGLFEKRKFVVGTEYCVTLDQVADEFYPEILANDAQLAEWRRVYRVDSWQGDLHWAGGFDLKLLEEHPYLMVDTAFFDSDFKGRLLQTFEDLDDAIDGVLIHGENFQALNLLSARYGSKVNCVYIDPPYNTGQDDFLYKDNYRHSSWLCMMADRLQLGRDLLSDDGVFLISIDDGEEHALRMVCDDLFGQQNFLANLVWKSRQNVDSRATNNISNDHEFILAYGRALRGGEKDVSKYSNPDDDPRGPWMSDNMVGLRSRRDRPNLHYDILVGVVEELPSVPTGAADQEWQIGEYRVLVGAGTPVDEPNGPIVVGRYVFVLGTQSEGGTFAARHLGDMTHLPCPTRPRSHIYRCAKKGWRYEPSSMAFRILDQRVIWPAEPTGRPRKKTFLNELTSAYTGFSSVVGYTRDGTTEMQNIFGEEVISFPKPTSLLSTLIEQCSDRASTIVDYFSGSGTTAHAIMNLNRADGGHRRYIMVEIADYFETALKPRIQKIAFSSAWKDGLPQGRDGQSHMFKYQRIESYEDALNNIRVEHPGAPQQALLYEKADDYMLSYMLDFETRGSPTLLSHGAFDKPFAYTLKIEHGRQTPQDTIVDLVETFHYLIGMHVRRFEQHEHQNRRYVVTRGEVRTDHGVETVVTLWRDTENLDLEKEADWVGEQLVNEPVDRVYVNGPSFIDKAEPLEITFRQLMEAPVNAV